ncbi:MAG: FprA family A-type flavoprotein [Planctomycetota bacterium]
MLKISEGVYWVGAIDWNLRFCGSYTTPRGTTYNAYLVIDEKIALIDTVKSGFEAEMLERIKEIIDPAKIDYVICQHAEADHAGAMPELMKIIPQARVVATPACKDIISEHFPMSRAWNIQTVKTGDQINLGQKTLRFIQTPMLHWPDNMVTYLKENGVLFSNDVFGQHIATNQRYDDEVGQPVVEEATKYFAVIVSLYSSLVQKKIKEIEEMALGIKMIAPAHGVIWREPGKIIDAYKRWSSGVAGRKVTIVFDTMWHSTEKMAGEIARGLMAENVEVRVFNLRSSDWSEIIKDIIESRMILVGSPTLNMGMYPTVGGFLTFLKGIKPQNKKSAAFGSYGWGKGAVKAITEELVKMNFQVLDGLEIKFIPDREELQTCFQFGKKLAQEV